MKKSLEKSKKDWMEKFIKERADGMYADKVPVVPTKSKGTQRILEFFGVNEEPPGKKFQWYYTYHSKTIPKHWVGYTAGQLRKGGYLEKEIDMGIPDDAILLAPQYELKFGYGEIDE